MKRKVARKDQVFAIASQKGGVGKTTTAVNLAACFTFAGKRTLLVDLDPQGNATSGVGISRSERSFLNACLIENLAIATQVREASFSGLAIIPASQELSDLNLHNEIKPRRMKAFQRLFLRLCDDFEYVVIDCPPSTGLLPELAFSVAQSVIVPVQCEYYAMEGLSQILPQVEKVQRELNERLAVGGLLLTMFDYELELSHEVADEVRSHFPKLVYRATIPRDVALAEASSHGQPIVSYDITSRGGWSYICLSKEVLGNDNS